MKNRDVRFDTLKGFLILLVVFGHILGNPFFCGDSLPLVSRYLYAGIFSFHMPAMVFISGYFSKKTAITAETCRKLIRTYLIPFALANGIIWLLASRSLTEALQVQYAMWFLLCLFFWKLMLPFAAQLRFALPFFTAFSLFIGLTEAGNTLAAARLFAFFPFFLAGYFMREEQVERLRALPKVLPVLVLLLCLASVSYLQYRGVTASIYYMTNPYRSLGLDAGKGLLLRVFVLFVGFIETLCLIALVPSRKNLLSRLGLYTLTIYLAHGVLIKGLARLPLGTELSGTLCLALVYPALTILICAVFGNRFTARCYDRVMDLIGRLVLRPGTERQAPADNAASKEDPA